MAAQNETTVTRRKFLGVSAAGAVGAMALSACATLGLPRVSKAYAGYQEHPSGKRHCRSCVHFQEPNGCTIVSGAIDKDAVCNYFLAER
jgi:hypothetical protein